MPLTDITLKTKKIRLLENVGAFFRKEDVLVRSEKRTQSGHDEWVKEYEVDIEGAPALTDRYVRLCKTAVIE